jgi:hypothetical protein
MHTRYVSEYRYSCSVLDSLACYNCILNQIQGCTTVVGKQGRDKSFGWFCWLLEDAFEDLLVGAPDIGISGLPEVENARQNCARDRVL